MKLKSGLDVPDDDLHITEDLRVWDSMGVPAFVFTEKEMRRPTDSEWVEIADQMIERWQQFKAEKLAPTHTPDISPA